MVQELRGRFVSLCARCRWEAPLRKGNTLQWRCPHKGVEIVEMPDGRIVATRERIQ